MSKLVIVESPNKIKSIEKYLGEGFEVKASVGHITYLPSSGEHRFGIDMETWTPNYKVDPKKQKVVAELKEALKGKDEVLIATDPDREGEAIANDLATFLKLKNYHRIRFNEITEDAVKAAVNKPSSIDENLVKSQITRRILDRIIGYKLSNLMKTKIKNSPAFPSAGRVQSIALKLVVEKEKLIKAFIPTEYITVQAKVGEDLFADLVSGGYEGNTTWVKPSDITEKKKSFKGALKVTKVSTTKRKDAKLTPLKQAALYKRADSKLGLSSTVVQSSAQRLYEGYGDGGLISYPRTDSTRYSNTFVNKAQAFISNKFGNEYVAKEIKGAAGAQDAHEAIRPTDLNLTPDKAKAIFNLSPAEFKVYQLIYNHAISTLMTVPLREVLRYDLSEGTEMFKLSSSKVIFEGYLKLTGYQASKELPKYSEGETLPVKDYVIEDKETKPPARYNDGSLIEKLDNIKVGRPSTFATTVRILKNREYVEMEGKALKPTYFGEVVLEKLLEAFPDIISEPYTASMEEKLDKISEGNYDHKHLLDDFWQYFNKELQTATQELQVTKLKDIPAGKDCPLCKKPLIVKTNKRDGSKFFACSGFPECRHTESDPNSKRKFWTKKNWAKKK